MARATSPSRIDRKAQQLCRQVARTLDLVLSGDSRDEVLQNARIMVAAANAVRSYTAQRAGPILAAASGERFEPMSVPSYAAQTNFKALTERYPDFTYKEAALNPTNPADRATDWEADFITAFRNRHGVEELTGERETPTGKVLTLARPITVANEGGPLSDVTNILHESALQGGNWRFQDFHFADYLSRKERRERSIHL